MLTDKAKALRALGGCVCTGCGDPVDELVTVQVDRFTERRLCSECAELLRDSITRCQTEIEKARAKITNVQAPFLR